MLFIETSKIKAAMECVLTAKADPRYYLRGVLLELTACGDVHLVSTDGERMFFGRIPATAVQWSNQWFDMSEERRKAFSKQIILPYEALKVAMKAKRYVSFIEHVAEKSYRVNGVDCQAISGSFPMWRNVVRTAFSTIQSEPGTMDWTRVATIENALRTWSGHKNATVRVKGIGSGVGALVTSDDTNAFALVMPQRKEDITPDFMPTFPAELEDDTQASAA